MNQPASEKMLRVELAATAAQVRLAAPLFDRYRVFYGQPPNLDASHRFLFARWVARESVLFLAFDGARAIGFVHLYPSFASATMQRLWILNDLYVDEDVRCNGIARALMHRAEMHARETGSVGLELSTAVTNVHAQALYESEHYVREKAFYSYCKLFADAPGAHA